MSHLVDTNSSTDKKLRKLEASIARLSSEVKQLKARVKVLETKNGVVSQSAQSQSSTVSGGDEDCRIS